jgi:hypothetical protein
MEYIKQIKKNKKILEKLSKPLDFKKSIKPKIVSLEAQLNAISLKEQHLKDPKNEEIHWRTFY